MTSFLCRDIISVFCPHANYDFNYRPVCFLIATWKLGRENVVSLLHVIPVATSKSCHDSSFFQSCRNLIFDLQQFPINSSSFSGRDLKRVSRLSSGSSYFFFVIEAQT